MVLFKWIENFIFFMQIAYTGHFFLNNNITTKKYYPIATLILTTLGTSISFLTNNSYIQFAVSFVCILIFMGIRFDSTPKRITLLSLVIIFILSNLNEMFEMLFHVIELIIQHPFPQNVCSLLTTLHTLIFLILIGKKIAQEHLFYNLDIKHLILGLFLLLADSFIVASFGDYTLHYAPYKRILLLGIMYILMVLGIFLQLYLLVSVTVSRDQIAVREAQTAQYLEDQIQHYEYLKNRERDTRKFRHDIKNHLLTLATLYQQEDYSTVDSYLLELTSQVELLGNRITVQNEIADAVINRFYSEALQHNIHFNIHGHFPNSCNLSAYCICTVLSNLLSNALAATIEAKGEGISMGIRSNEQQIFFTIENPYCTTPVIEKGHFLTHKADMKNHGLGLENVNLCIKKNGGYLETHTENNIFSVHVCLNNIA